MKRVYLAQLKCPANHAILALAGEYESAQAAEVMRGALLRMFEEATNARIINRECAICHSITFHIDIGRTAWTTLAEAEEPLKQSSADQLASREAILGLQEKAKNN